MSNIRNDSLFFCPTKLNRKSEHYRIRYTTYGKIIMHLLNSPIGAWAGPYGHALADSVIHISKISTTTLHIHATLGEVVVYMRSFIANLEGGRFITTGVKMSFLSGELVKLLCVFRLLWIWSGLFALGKLLSLSSFGLRGDHRYVPTLNFSPSTYMDLCICPPVSGMHGIVVWRDWNCKFLEHGIVWFWLCVESLVFYVSVSMVYEIWLSRMGSRRVWPAGCFVCRGTPCLNNCRIVRVLVYGKFCLFLGYYEFVRVWY